MPKLSLVKHAWAWAPPEKPPAREPHQFPQLLVFSFQSSTISRAQWSHQLPLIHYSFIHSRNTYGAFTITHTGIHWITDLRFSKCGARTRNSSITWELIRNANSWAPPQTYWTVNSEGGPQQSVLLRNPPGDTDAHLSWRTTSTDSTLMDREW